jgi:hypothetical protein
MASSGRSFPVPDAPADRVGGQHDERGRDHRERDDEREERAPVTRQDADLTRHAEHDERELAALAEQAGEEQVSAARHPCGACYPDEKRRFERYESHDEAQEEPGVVGEQGEVDRHADRDEEEPEQEALERLDVGLERVAILAAREQHAGQERAERHRDAGELHHLGDADDEQQRERREDLAEVRARDRAERRARRVPADHDHDDDRRRDRRGAHPRRRAVAARLLGTEQRDDADQRNGRDVLEEEDAERDATERRVQEPRARSSSAPRSPSTRARARTRDDRRAPRQADRPRGDREGQAADAHLQVPPPKTLPRIAHRRAGSSSRPIANSISTTPNSAKWRIASTSWTSASPNGPITHPANRYPSTEPSPRRLASGTKTTAAPR